MEVFTLRMEQARVRYVDGHDMTVHHESVANLRVLFGRGTLFKGIWGRADL